MIAAQDLPGRTQGYNLVDRFDRYEQMAQSIIAGHIHAHSDVEAAKEHIMDAFFAAEDSAGKYELTSDIFLDSAAFGQAAQALAIPREDARSFAHDCASVMEDWKNESETQARIPMVGERYAFIYAEDPAADQLEQVAKEAGVPIYTREIDPSEWNYDSGNRHTQAKEFEAEIASDAGGKAQALESIPTTLMPQRADPALMKYEYTLGDGGASKIQDDKIAEIASRGTLKGTFTKREFNSLLEKEGVAMSSTLHALENELREPMPVDDITVEKQAEDSMILKSCQRYLESFPNSAIVQLELDACRARMAYRSQALKVGNPQVRLKAQMRNEGIREAAKNAGGPRTFAMIPLSQTNKFEAAVMDNPDPVIRALAPRMSEAQMVCFEDENRMRRECDPVMRQMDEKCGYPHEYRSNAQIREDIKDRTAREVAEKLYRQLAPDGNRVHKTMPPEHGILLAVSDYLRATGQIQAPASRFQEKYMSQAVQAPKQTTERMSSAPAKPQAVPAQKQTAPVRQPEAPAQVQSSREGTAEAVQLVTETATILTIPKPSEIDPVLEAVAGEPTVLEAAAGETARQEQEEVREQVEEAQRQAEIEAQRHASGEPDLVDEVLEAGAAAAAGMALTATQVASMQSEPEMPVLNPAGPELEAFNKLPEQGLEKGLQNYRALLSTLGNVAPMTMNNALAVHEQNPEATVVKTREDWARFGYAPAPDAQALTVKVKPVNGQELAQVFDASQVVDKDGNHPTAPPQPDAQTLASALRLDMSQARSPEGFLPYALTDKMARAMDFPADPAHRNASQEFLARSAAYAVCSHFGVELDKSTWAKQAANMFAARTAGQFFAVNPPDVYLGKVSQVVNRTVQTAEHSLARKDPQRAALMSPKAVETIREANEKQAQKAETRAPKPEKKAPEQTRKQAPRDMSRD